MGAVLLKSKSLKRPLQKVQQSFMYGFLEPSVNGDYRNTPMRMQAIRKKIRKNGLDQRRLSVFVRYLTLAGTSNIDYGWNPNSSY